MIQCDFFDVPIPSDDKKFDVVGLSLVVNFEGSLTRRGECSLGFSIVLARLTSPNAQLKCCNTLTRTSNPLVSSTSFFPFPASPTRVT